MRSHTLAIALLFATAAACPASAAGFDGTWTCKANGDIPIGILTISGLDYRLQETDAGGSPNGKGGSGALSAAGNAIAPVDGPLTAFEASGNIESDVLFWNNAAGTIMACWQF